MRKLFFVLAFMLVGSFAFANNSVEKEPIIETSKIDNLIKSNDYILKSTIIFQTFDICTITVDIYHDGVLVSSATWTDNDGNCELARAGATMMAYSFLLK